MQEEEQLFSVRTTTPEIWKRIVSSISTLLEEATFSISPQRGITFRGMDPSHIAMLDLSLSPNDFERFECSKEDRFTLRLEDFKKIIARAGATDSVQISRTGQDALEVKLGEFRRFEFHLLEAHASSTPVPKLSFSTTLALENRLFEGVLEDIGTVSDHVTIQSSLDSIILSAKGDSGSGKATLAKDQLAKLELKEDAISTYNLEYLHKITKASGAGGDVITLEYSTKMPLKVTYKLGGSSQMVFYLAPRTE